MSKLPDGPPDVRERIEYLLDTSARHDFGATASVGRYTNQWLRPDTRIRSSTISRGFLLDNLGIYPAFAESIIQPRGDVDTFTARELIGQFVRGLNKEYAAGGHEAFMKFEAGGKASVFNRFRKPVSAYSPNRAGSTCTIITSEAHNLAHFIGLPTLSLIGNTVYRGRSGQVEGGAHMFSLSAMEPGAVLWDPTNPLLCPREGNKHLEFQEPLGPMRLTDLAFGDAVELKSGAVIDPEDDVRTFTFTVGDLVPNAVMAARLNFWGELAMAEDMRPSEFHKKGREMAQHDFLKIAGAHPEPYFHTFFEARVAELS